MACIIVNEKSGKYLMEFLNFDMYDGWQGKISMDNQNDFLHEISFIVVKKLQIQQNSSRKSVSKNLLYMMEHLQEAETPG